MAVDAGLRIFALDHPQVARTLRGKLGKRRAELIELLAKGNAEDYADYRNRVGVLSGLDEAMQICEAVEAEMLKG